MMIINILGLLFIGLIIWWFWLYKPDKAVDASKENITIIVSKGIYEPSRIKTVSGKKTSLIFLRKDGSACASTVLFPDFEISEELPLNSKKIVDLPSMSPGEYLFHCPMNMYSGTLVVE